MSSNSRLFRSAGLVCIGLLIGTYYNDNSININYSSEVTGNIRVEQQQQTLSTEDKDSTHDEPISLLDIPRSTKQLIMNVGTSIDPIMPPKSYGPCSHSIAIEPIVGHDIQPHKQLSVIHAAVSDKPGLTSMNIYNTGGQSSSLAKPSKQNYWNSNTGRGDGRTIFVPVITLSSLINAIPNTTEISLLKTDMQGFDYVAIKEAGSILTKRVKHIMTEVWMNDHYTYFATNDLCRDFMPLMTSLGYELMKLSSSADTPDQIKVRCDVQLKNTPIRPKVEEAAGLDERDAYWVRKDSAGETFPDCPNIKKLDYSYTNEEYATCV